MSIAIIATIEALPAHREAVAEALNKVVAPSRTDAGNHHYHLNVDPNDSNVFVMIEQWESSQALEAHMATPHFQEMAATIDGKLVRPLDVRQLDVID